jgi:hypothetical protein
MLAKVLFFLSLLNMFPVTPKKHKYGQVNELFRLHITPSRNCSELDELTKKT